MSKIYTKFGDKGETRLVGGACVQKNNPRVECYGSVDELNSSLGVVIATLSTTPHAELCVSLIAIQNQLFNLGSLLACEKKETLPFLPKIRESDILGLEKLIDEMSAQLPTLKNFILPGGSLTAAHLHVARTTCRRAERNTVGLIQQLDGQLSGEEQELLFTCLGYLNRLSDYLFIAARFANQAQGLKDQVWQKQ